MSKKLEVTGFKSSFLPLTGCVALSKPSSWVWDQIRSVGLNLLEMMGPFENPMRTINLIPLWKICYMVYTISRDSRIPWNLSMNFKGWQQPWTKNVWHTWLHRAPPTFKFYDLPYLEIAFSVSLASPIIYFFKIRCVKGLSWYLVLNMQDPSNNPFLPFKISWLPMSTKIFPFSNFLNH